VSPLEQVLRLLVSDLEKAGCRWALVGGLAVSARARPRFTNDVDLAVAVANDAEAETLIFSLAGTYRVLACLEHEGRGRLSTVRLLPPGQDEEGIIVDLLFASSGIESELVEAATPLEVFDGLRMPVAMPGHLLAMKLLAMDDARRPQDRPDILALLEQTDAAELVRARESIGIIHQRGYHRDRDLVALLDGMLASRVSASS